jgi:DNA primase
VIAQRTIDEILDRASLQEIVAEAVPLKRQGRSYVGLCPFHAEKSPSFHVRDDRFYHCFGCGVSGNVISYLMRVRGLGFPEAVEELAGRLGIPVAYEGSRRPKSETVDKTKIFAANLQAAHYFRACLVSTHTGKAPPSFARAQEAAQQYLRERNIGVEAQRIFNIGCAPAERDALHQYLRKKGHEQSLLLQAGLIKRSQRGDIYDTFRARLMFPIATDSRHIAGFGGRLIPALVDQSALTKAPKYLNSSDSPAYHKHSVFFGLPQALAAIRDSRKAYLVEGYLDVVGLWQVGVRQALATCGTAVTTPHVKRLKHLIRAVTLLFDGDAAGRTAAGKSFPVFLNSGIDVSAAFLPEGHDPDTFAALHQSNTAEALEALPHVPLIECFVDLLIERTGASSAGDLGGASKGRLCEELAGVLREVTNTIEQSELIERASLKLGVDGGLLRRMVLSSASQGGGMKPRRSSNGTSAGEGSSARHQDAPAAQDSTTRAEVIPPVDSLPRLDRELLLATMAKKEELPRALLADPDLSTRVTQSTLRFVEALATIMEDATSSGDQKKEALKELLDSCGESWRNLWKQAYAMAQDREVNFERIFEECRESFLRNAISEQIRALEQQAKISESEAERAAFSQQQLALKRQLASRERRPARSSHTN